MPTSAMIVPACPAGVIFHREDFLETDFDIDKFLAKYAGNFGLETLRDDLGMYLQVLRVAMIELINDDYADFVNLSSNLVGIDAKIAAIEEPVRESRQQILTFQRKLQATQDQLEAKLQERKSLHDQRVALRNLEHIINLLNKVERLMGLHSEQDETCQTSGSGELHGDLIERVASDVNYLNHCVAKCGALAFVEEIRPRMESIWDHLDATLKAQFLKSFEENDGEVLKQCLRIYASLDRVCDVENLVKKEIVSPYLEEVINSSKLHSDGLSGICQNILEIIPEKLALLLQLSNFKRKRKDNYNFILNALLPEVVARFESGLPMVFSAGNPDQFHANYQTVMAFIQDLESHVAPNQLIEFRSSKILQTFVHRWNLSVYFQIRFQEIGSMLEEACQPPNFLILTSDSSPNFHLQASATAVEAVNQCWKSNVFLKPLTQKFWKLTLQILARYAKAVDNAEDSLKLSSEEDVEKEKIFILLHQDISKMAEENLDLILTSLVTPRLALEDAKSLAYFQECLEETKLVFKQRQSDLSEKIVDSVVETSVGCLKQVADIPRLYRRTNRELPGKPCAYMTSLLEPIHQFASSEAVLKSPKLRQVWIESIFAKISSSFLSNVSEVLDAVQKMEESLLRLRRVRDKAASNTSMASASGDKKVSDDDKIRLQLFVDVKHYISVMKELGVVKLDHSAEEVERLVSEAVKAIILPGGTTDLISS